MNSSTAKDTQKKPVLKTKKSNIKKLINKRRRKKVQMNNLKIK